MINIQKSYSFCYGHRVWNQELTNNAVCKCVMMHGHTSKIDIKLTAPELLRNMVVDFNELKPFKQWLDETLDHRFLMDIKDPLLDRWLMMLGLTLDGFQCFGDYWKVSTINPWWDDAMLEMADSLVLIEGVPTSERLVLLVEGVVEGFVKPFGCEVVSVRWWESETSFAEYVK
jgi:6-pyruvoyltetrahydropterin/6-carboxytetrahydropterin synthase